MKCLKQKIVTGLLVLTLCIFTGCGNATGQSEDQFTDTMTVDELQSESGVINEEQVMQVYIYITLNGTDFTRYAYDSETVSYEGLIQAISEKTGWNLALTGEIVTVKDGISVGISKDSCVFTGEVSGAAEGYTVASHKDMVAAALGSIAKTMQYYDSETNPDGTHIYFHTEDDGPVVVDGIIDLPVDAPYSYEVLK